MAEKAGLLWPRLPRKLGRGQACQALPGRIFPVGLAKNPESLASRLFQAGRVFDRAPDAFSEETIQNSLNAARSPKDKNAIYHEVKVQLESKGKLFDSTILETEFIQECTIGLPFSSFLNERYDNVTKDEEICFIDVRYLQRSNCNYK